MRKLPLFILSAFFISPLTAWGDQDDDSLAAFTFENYSRALELAQPAAQNNDLMAQFVLGRIYQGGKGISQDKAKADKWFGKALSAARPAAQSGEPRAQWIIGRMHYEGWILAKDAAQAAAWYRKSAKQGYAPAQVGLGYLCSTGLGVAKDERKEIVWYRKAAEQNYSPGLYNLAWTFYRDGNWSEAASWYRKAADQGYPAAQVNLGMMYMEGKGVGKDDTEAVALFRKAAERGRPEGQQKLGWMYLQGHGVSKDEKEAVAWYRRAAEQGHAAGQDSLGVMYRDGAGVSQNNSEAVALFRKAAEQGNPEGQLNLGYMYQNGLGFAKDMGMAVSWYLKAAEQGNAAAQNNLGIMYRDALGISKDDSAALGWFRKASAQGYANGQANLAYMYYSGRGVPKDVREAVSLYRKAGEQGNEHALAQLRILEAVPESQVASTALSKEDIRDMIQSALKPAAESQASKVIASDVDKPGYTTPENADNFAVVIGVEKYSSLPSADFAERDAESMRAHLMAMGYPARNIFFLSGQQATRAKIAQSVNTWLPSRVTPTSSVFFYYSGHGAPDPQTNQAYLVPMDGDPEDLDSTAYPIKLLYEKLGKLKSRQVVVALDSCFSGAGGRSVLAKGTRPLVGKIDMGGLPDTVVALTASDKSQISGTIEEQGHGAFTYYMLKGLEGGAKNGDGRVTAQSLHDYLTPKVRDAARLNNREQIPQLMNGVRGKMPLR